MIKNQTNYSEEFMINWDLEILEIEVNEESKQVRLKFFQERWRNIEEWKEFIDYLSDFIDNMEDNLKLKVK